MIWDDLRRIVMLQKVPLDFGVIGITVTARAPRPWPTWRERDDKKRSAVEMGITFVGSKPVQVVFKLKRSDARPPVEMELRIP
jgi:hypothetical protein